MALTFTDQQLKDISSEYLGIPAAIASLDQTLVDIGIQKTKAQDQDTANKVFSDNGINIVSQYHEELKKLSGPTRTNYVEAKVVSAGKLEDGNEHFPTSPVWVNFQPKVADSNNGNPITNTTPHESSKITELSPYVTQIISGFTDGALTDTLATAYAAGTFEVDNGGYALGQRVVIEDAGVSAFGVITALNTPPPVTGLQTITINVLAAPLGALGVGAEIKNFHAGFSNADRLAHASTVFPEYFTYLANLIDTLVAAIETFLDAELAALNLNDAPAPEAAEITTAKTNVNSFKGVIDTFQGDPQRLGDTQIAPLQGKIASRPGEITSRSSQIVTRLGSVTQNPDGTFSGSENYFKLFNFVNIRTNKIEGTLRKFYAIDLGKTAIEQKKATLQDKQTEYNNTFFITKLTADTDGTNIIKVTDASGLGMGNTIKIMDNDQPVISRNITAITLNDVQVDSPVPAGYLVSKLARVVKQL